MIDIDQLKNEIKQELYSELKNEVQSIILEELKLLIVQDKEFQKYLSTYAKSLIYSEMKYLKMLERGFRNVPAGTEYVIENSKNNFISGDWVNLDQHSQEDLRTIHSQLIDEKKADTPFEIFISVLFDKSSEKINWIHKTKDREAVNSHSIFDLFYHLDSEIINYKSNNLKRFLDKIISKFTEEDNLFTYDRIYDSFSKWKNKHK